MARSGKVNAVYLNFRSGAGTNHAKIGLLAPHTPFTLLAQHGDWLEIKAMDNVGFVHGGYVTLEPISGKERKGASILGKQGIGMTLSHYEFDLDLLDDAGQINEIPVENAGTMPQILSGFNVLRFMNWQKTNVAPIWKDGNLPEFHWPPEDVKQLKAWNARTDWRQPVTPKAILASKWGENPGIPLQICLNVALQANAHPWICIPHGKSKTDFEELVAYITIETESMLNGSGLTPIYEFSNEVWNSGRFRQQQEVANVALGRDVHYRSGDGQDEAARKERQLNRSKAFERQIECTNYIKSVVKDAGIVIISAQCNNPEVARALCDNSAIKLSSAVDALAIAPYYGPVRNIEKGWKEISDILPRGFHPLIDLRSTKTINPWVINANSLQELYQNLLTYVRGGKDIHGDEVGGEIRRNFTAHRNIIDRYNQKAGRQDNPLQLVAYEGGLNLNYVARDFEQQSRSLLTINPEFSAAMKREGVLKFYRAFHHSWQAGQLVKDVLDLWGSDEVDGDLFVGYSSATRYQLTSGDLKGDFFGHIDLIDRPGQNNDDRYRATYKLKALLERAAAKN